MKEKPFGVSSEITSRTMLGAERPFKLARFVEPDLTAREQ